MKFNCCVIIQLKKSSAVAYRIMNFVGWDLVTKKASAGIELCPVCFSPAST